MSLSVGKFFNKALSENADIIEVTEGRIFPIARTTEDEKEDKIPYIIIMPSGVQNQPTTKEEVESPFDSAPVTLLCVAETYPDLVDITEQVRSCIKSAMEDEDFQSEAWSFTIDSYVFSADRVQYDPSKPCFYQELTYTCDTYNK